MKSKLGEPVAHFRERDGAIQSVGEHLRGVSTLAKGFARKFGCEEAGELIGLLHDLGKYSVEFQNYLCSAVELIDPDADGAVDAEAMKGKVDHSTAGAQHIWQAYGNRGPIEHVMAQLLAICIASHHSGLIDCIGAGPENFGRDVFGKRMDKSHELTHLDEVLERADVEILERARALMSAPSLTQALQAKMVGFLKGSKASFKAPVAMNHMALFARLMFSCLIDADRIDTADFEWVRQSKNRPLGEYVDWAVLVGRLETHLNALAASKPIDHLRREIANHCAEGARRGKGIYTLTVPTGGGKTLASLRFALRHASEHRMDRVLYVIPFTSIIDQNASVVRISAIVDACFRLIVDGVSAPSWTRNGCAQAGIRMYLNRPRSV